MSGTRTFVEGPDVHGAYRPDFDEFTFVVRDDPERLQPPHPCDPNRLSGWPASGYGWPCDEALVLLRGAVAFQAAKDARKISSRERFR